MPLQLQRIAELNEFPDFNNYLMYVMTQLEGQGKNK